MWRCDIKAWSVLPVLAVFIVYGCSTKPVVKHRIDFDTFPAAVADRDHCPDQENMLVQAGEMLAAKDYTRALHLVATIIGTPCSRQNYSRALLIAGQVFAARNEDHQAFSFYREGLSQAGDSREAQLFFDYILDLTEQMPSGRIISMTDGTDDRQLTRKILYGAAVRKQALQDAAGAEELLQEMENRFPGTREVDAAASIPVQIQTPAFHNDRIGVLLPLSGFYEAAGERALNAIHMAVDQMNRSGKGNFTLLVEDSFSDPAAAAAAVESLEKKGAACIIGPMVTAEPAAEKAQKLGIPMITLTQAEGIPKIGEYVFRHFITPVSQAHTLVSHAMNELGYTRFAVLYPEDRYGERFRNAFLRAVDAHGGSVTKQAVYTPGQTDFTAQISSFISGFKKLDAQRNLVDLKPHEKKQKNRIYRAAVDFDAVFVPDTQDAAAMIARQFIFHGIRQAALLGPNIWNPQAFVQMEGLYPPQIVFPVDFFAEDAAEQVQQFVTAYTDAFGTAPGYFAAIAFDTARLVMHCLQQSGVTSKTGLIQVLKTVKYDSNITCPIAFDSNGECIKDLDLFQITGRKIMIYQACDK